MTVTDPVATISRIGRHWGWLLAFGILTVALGVCAVVWPAITLLAAAIVFGVQLIVAGIYAVSASAGAWRQRPPTSRATTFVRRRDRRRQSCRAHPARP
jgi:uncharacterized membrane protein HdeD (DUF308 family)